LPVRHLIRSSALLPLLPLLVVGLATQAVAQSTTSLLPDADLLPSWTFRIRGLSAWTRYDELLGTGGPVPRNIAFPLATDSLTPQQVPSFAPIEQQIRTSSGLPTFRLTAGNIVALADSRVVTGPLILEYGIASRITIGVVVPIVETRTTLFSQLNPKVGAATVGPNPALLPASAALNQNATLVQSFRTAGTALQAKLTQCQATPADTTCTAILGQQAAVTALIQSSGTFANGLETLYGTDRTAHPGMSYVPIDLSPAQAAINTKITAFATQYKTFLGTDAITGKVVPAAGPGAQLDLESLFRSVGYDTLTSTDHTSIGDVSVGMSVQLINTYGDTTAAGQSMPHMRLAVNGTYRFATGQLANPNRPFDISTGVGVPGVIVSGAADLQYRRLSATGTGSFTKQLGTTNVARVPSAANAIFPLAPAVPGTYQPGNVIEISVVPRVRLAGYLALTGQYSLVETMADTYTIPGLPADVLTPTSPFGIASWTAQQIGVGITYSSIVRANRGPGVIPFEVNFSHLETITGNGGPFNKAFRDQIELRIYWKP
jgi:hypothetical protein